MERALSIGESMKAKEAIQVLKEGNERYIDSLCCIGDTSKEKRVTTYIKGQHPIAVIISCSDSRVIPESIFSSGIGDLFVIRIAGNVMDDHQLGSVEYACSHLGVHLIVVLGHTHCGAVDATINHDPEGYIKFITDEIKKAIQDETDPYKAAVLNIEHSVKIIENSFEIHEMEEHDGLKVIGAMYDIETGKVNFLVD